jgi:hypothetical protein
LFYIPTSSGPVGFTNDTSDSSKITTGFGFYGHVLYVLINGKMVTEWYAVPTDDESIWQLSWNTEGSTSSPLAIRNIAPSS